MACTTQRKTLSTADFERLVISCEEAMSLPPKVPTIIDSDDFSLFTACSAKLVIQNTKGLKLRSNTSTIMVLVRKIRLLLGPMLEVNQEYDSTGEIKVNLDTVVKKVLQPTISSIPECLAGTIEKDKITENLDPKIKEEPNVMTDRAEETIKEQMVKFGNDNAKQRDEIKDYINNISDLLCDKEDLELFLLIDRIVILIDNSGYTEILMEFFDDILCVSTNCERLAPSLFKDDFLWYDLQKLKLKVPVDIGSGFVKLFKMYPSLCPEKIARAEVVETRYYKFVERRLKVLMDASEKVANIKSIVNNPFDALVKENAAINITKVNTLF